MRHKYDTRGIILGRAPLGEANALVTVLTPELGLLYARAQGVRRSKAKLAPALVTFAESDLTLVRGKEGWRLTGAVLHENWFSRLARAAPRRAAARLTGLLLRLSPRETPETPLYDIFHGFLDALAGDAHADAAEVLAALYLLSALGLEGGALPEVPGVFSAALLEGAHADRASYIARINHGIAASGL